MTKDQIYSWLSSCNINSRNFVIHDDLSVDIKGNFYLRVSQMTTLPVDFNYVDGDFDISSNKLETLRGCPQRVSGNFNCSSNLLKSLRYGPTDVGGFYNCSENQLVNLKGSPEKINLNFIAYKNKLKSLEGGPKEVLGGFFCHANELTSLMGSPRIIGGMMDCSDNDLESLKNSTSHVGDVFECRRNRGQVTSLDDFDTQVGNLFIYSSFAGLIKDMQAFYDRQELLTIPGKALQSIVMKHVLEDELRSRFERNLALARQGGNPSSEYFLDKCGSEAGDMYDSVKLKIKL